MVGCASGMLTLMQNTAGRHQSQFKNTQMGNNCNKPMMLHKSETDCFPKRPKKSRPSRFKIKIHFASDLQTVAFPPHSPPSNSRHRSAASFLPPRLKFVQICASIPHYHGWLLNLCQAHSNECRNGHIAKKELSFIHPIWDGRGRAPKTCDSTS